ncbi:MAG TPA: ArsA-related P-loop ATPase, partial [Vulgatibacter sp.]|nr:ArsA-related P-loop ATPase [Vulgatibacter sp.]
TMLDLQRSWDDFIARHVLPGQREALLRNRFYQTLSSALAGSQEYIATERLYEVHSRGDYDLLVLDTPPTSHALDFLDAPRRILDFLDQGSFRAVTGPALAAGRLGLKLMTLGGSVVGKALSRLTGTETLEELTAFMLEIQGTYGVFKDRAAKVKALFASDDAAFVLVTSAHGANVDETIFFHERLAAERIPVAGVVANRVHPDFLEGAPVPDSAALAAALAAAGLDDPGQPPLSERLVQTLAEARAIADADRRSLERLASATRPTPLHRVPRFDSDLYDLPGLWELSRHLFQRG